MSKLNAYYQLTKPGVLYGNVLTALAGYFLAAAGSIDITTLFAVLIGQTLIIASACVLNNYLDQDIDSIMNRTKKRPSVTKAVGDTAMQVYAGVLVALGFAVLVAYTNWLVVAIGIIGYVTYVWLYGAMSKRRSIHGTLVGSISGAMPIAGGYAAVNGVIDPGLIISFLILFFWQFPEFYSIAIYRKNEYAAASVPVMPVVKGIHSTILQIVMYTVLYVVSTLALTVFGYTGYIYLGIMTVIGIYWIIISLKGPTAEDPEVWARKMFRISMYHILVLCLMLSIGPLLP